MRQNRALVAETLGVPPDRLLTLYQIHSATAVIVDKPWDGTAAEADALVTRTPGLAIGALTADCAPVLFCDAQARVIAASHAGWRGALSGIVEATVATMEELGAKRERTVAVIGPSISQRAYEVGTDYRERFLAEEPGSEAFFVTDDSSGEPHFDLTGYVAERLRAPASAPSQTLDFALIATKPACSAIAGRNTTARKTTDVKFPPSCSPDPHSP